MIVPTIWHVAEINVGKIIAPYHDPIMVGFVQGMAHINEQAERAHGFVWRLKLIDDPPGTESQIFGENMVVNVSVWESTDQLIIFTYTGDHLDFYQRRAEWIEKSTAPMMAMWYIRTGTVPTLDEAKQRLDYICEHGASPYAFTMRHSYPVPD